MKEEVIPTNFQIEEVILPPREGIFCDFDRAEYIIFNPSTKERFKVKNRKIIKKIENEKTPPS
jgi:translation elongation factor P/translation initiation factor 5A